MLENTVGKLAEKLVVEELLRDEELWHPLSFVSRKGRGAVDSVMLVKHMLETTGVVGSCVCSLQEGVPTCGGGTRFYCGMMICRTAFIVL